ncbi:MAG: hypothetical protein ABTD50_17205 [Polyangiaceae bacterium]
MPTVPTRSSWLAGLLSPVEGGALEQPICKEVVVTKPRTIALLKTDFTVGDLSKWVLAQWGRVTQDSLRPRGG